MPASGEARHAGRGYRLGAALAAALLAGLGPPVPLARAVDPGQVCAQCHGEKGVASMPLTPSLAGQPVLFTQIQLFLFREGQRMNEQMTPVAQGLSDEDLTALAEYYAALPPPAPAAPADPALDARGREIAAARRCGSCHLPDYAGREQMPRIAAQREDYLLKALRDYRSGARSGEGAQMAEVVYGMSDEEFQAVAHHIAHFKAP